MSYKACVEKFCRECTYDSEDSGSWRQQVERCNATSCPLHPVRPRSMATINANRKTRNAQIDVAVVQTEVTEEAEEV